MYMQQAGYWCKHSFFASSSIGHLFAFVKTENCCRNISIFGCNIFRLNLIHYVSFDVYSQHLTLFFYTLQLSRASYRRVQHFLKIATWLQAGPRSTDKKYQLLFFLFEVLPNIVNPTGYVRRGIPHCFLHSKGNGILSNGHIHRFPLVRLIFSLIRSIY